MKYTENSPYNIIEAYFPVLDLNVENFIRCHKYNSGFHPYGFVATGGNKTPKIYIVFDGYHLQKSFRACHGRALDIDSLYANCEYLIKETKIKFPQPQFEDVRVFFWAARPHEDMERERYSEWYENEQKLYSRGAYIPNHYNISFEKTIKTAIKHDDYLRQCPNIDAGICATIKNIRAGDDDYLIVSTLDSRNMPNKDGGILTAIDNCRIPKQNRCLVTYQTGGNTGGVPALCETTKFRWLDVTPKQVILSPEMANLPAFFGLAAE